MTLAENNFNMARFIDRFSSYLFFLFLLLQIIFWYNTEHLKPKLDILPKLQSKKSIEGLSFGDKEFYFRNLSIKLKILVTVLVITLLLGSMIINFYIIG